MRSTLRILRELDATIATAKIEGRFPDTGCKKGCNHCCYQQVEVSVDEVKLIQKHLKETLTKNQYREAKKKAKHNREAFSSIDNTQDFMGKGIPCQFLTDDGCSIYEVRPTMCRTYFAPNSEKCASGLDRAINGERNFTIPIINIGPLVVEALGMMDRRRIPLHSALLMSKDNVDELGGELL